MSKYPRLSLFFVFLLLTLSTGLVTADHTADPGSVTIAGDFQEELGCPGGDWDVTCALTHLTYDADDDVWQGTFNIPTGSWNYKAALNDSWDENYGRYAVPGGDDIPLNLGGATDVKFYYDHKSHWITDNVNSRIATAAGNFQSELGCPGDWQPWCLRSWLQDPEEDNIYTFITDEIPAGDYEAKVAMNEDWGESYPGTNMPFTVPNTGDQVIFTFDSTTNTPNIEVISKEIDDIEYFGLGHNSHDTLYRVPFGAVTPGTEVLLRFRTFHDDVTSVTTRVYSTATASESFLTMSRVAEDVSCYDADQPDRTCDFWQTSITPSEIGLLYYRFIIRDGSATAYYDDDYFIDGGWGEANPAPEDD
ncbi:MAG: hypothetical protein R3293_17805, partial [Candidatus Promineifilaceae bacterium]|nr:hypothetical protein [Candidatus Promineifilaceae bacterium]